MFLQSRGSGQRYSHRWNSLVPERKRSAIFGRDYFAVGYFAVIVLGFGLVGVWEYRH